MKNKKIAFIGLGNMAGAIFRSAVNQKYIDEGDAVVFDSYPSQYEKYFKEGFSLTAADSARQAAMGADFILLGVKPQSDVSGILSEISSLDISEKTFISIIAGVKIETLEKFIGKKAAVIRTMPNAPLLIGRGVTALCRNEHVSDESFTFARGLFNSGGTTVILREDEINAITSVTSSSVAYFAYFASSIFRASKKLGLELDDETLLNLIYDSAAGSFRLMSDTGLTPDALIKMVASPGGTTEKALNIFDEKDLGGIILEAMDACVRRADELSLFPQQRRGE